MTYWAAVAGSRALRSRSNYLHFLFVSKCISSHLYWEMSQLYSLGVYYKQNGTFHQLQTTFSGCVSISFRCS